MFAGFSLAKRDLPGRNFIMLMYIFTMYFGGGMIPYYLVVKGLGMLNLRITLIILGSVSVYNIIVVRSFMASNIPDDLWDAATIDGCGIGRFFFKIVMPLSRAVIAVMVLYIAVSHWNSYFNAMMFITDSSKYPLQLFLREILMIGQAMNTEAELLMDPESAEAVRQMVMVIKYSIIVVATVPILCVYPFIQKYFVKGVMIGSVKG
jgi:putative aldouronate transport system permease protein